MKSFTISWRRESSRIIPPLLAPIVNRQPQRCFRIHLLFTAALSRIHEYRVLWNPSFINRLLYAILRLIYPNEYGSGEAVGSNCSAKNSRDAVHEWKLQRLSFDGQGGRTAETGVCGPIDRYLFEQKWRKQKRIVLKTRLSPWDTTWMLGTRRCVSSNSFAWKVWATPRFISRLHLLNSLTH